MQPRAWQDIFIQRPKKSKLWKFHGTSPKLDDLTTSQKMNFGSKYFGFVFWAIKWSQYPKNKKIGRGHSEECFNLTEYGS